MGLSFYVENVGQDECYIAIDMKSVVAMIDKKITYPSREVSLESNTMIIHFWRGMNKGIGKGMVGIGDKSKQKV